MNFYTQEELEKLNRTLTKEETDQAFTYLIKLIIRNKTTEARDYVNELRFKI
jgi:hypothetical protein